MTKIKTYGEFLNELNYNRITKLGGPQTKEEVHKICKSLGIENYKINQDLSIDVNGVIDLINKKLTLLPLKFNKVKGWFDCSNNRLTSLQGAPKEVGGH